MEGMKSQEEIWRLFVSAVRHSGLTERDLVNVSEGTLKALAGHAGFAANPVDMARIEVQWRYLRDTGLLMGSSVYSKSPARSIRSVERSRSRSRSPLPAGGNPEEFVVPKAKVKPGFSTRKPLGDRRPIRGITPEPGEDRGRRELASSRFSPHDSPLPPYHCGKSTAVPVTPPRLTVKPAPNTFDRTMTNHLHRSVSSDFPARKSRASSYSPQRREPVPSSRARSPNHVHNFSSSILSPPEAPHKNTRRMAYLSKATQSSLTTLR
eukprot:TRINITY_DN17301_c0_g1_i1.p1 TRINITY_DN17301_c0_g1~~TRINITY_DN17301_c0_g1_i1.p1  ORF type:complete len:281 (+),score=22.08 TRINITY_DN17301_c0_g1_i1:51-845(+)